SESAAKSWSSERPVAVEGDWRSSLERRRMLSTLSKKESPACSRMICPSQVVRVRTLFRNFSSIGFVFYYFALTLIREACRISRLSIAETSIRVRVRLQRVGRPRVPHFRIVAIDSRKARDAASLEVIGHFHPKDKAHKLTVDAERLTFWLAHGAQASDTL